MMPDSMSKTSKSSTSGQSKNKQFENILNEFIKDEKIYYATETFLKNGFGIITLPNNPNCAENDYFRNNDTDYQYVNKALEKVRCIMPMGYISRDTLKTKRKGEIASSIVVPQRYDTIKVFACEAKENIARDDIAALVRAFNRISSANDEIYQTKNRPVIVLIRHGQKLSISTCERSHRTSDHDNIGKAIILHHIDCERPLKGHLQILANMAKEIKKCNTFDEMFEKFMKSLSIDIVSDNFFNGYTKLFKEIVKYALENKSVSKEFRKYSDPPKAIRDYVKILMGRIVFIHFLQRKGWMGVRDDDNSWTSGDLEFLQNRFEQSEKKETFVHDVLIPLFNDLNTKRDNDLASECLGKDIKLPYLNGGLFDKDEYADVKFRLPAELMKKILEFFRSYNFTIDENAQDAVEVGVDPEMLSRIFESLLEDNNATGAFYTPKEIVDYMCREALATYLGTDASKSKKAVYKDFILNHKVETLNHDDIEYVAQKLQSVKICDPAIGSGAFPMGMLKELFECRKAIELFKNGECNPSVLKKDIIQNSIYGVDIEKGAVDIARLRFWLSLIIDEKTPDALPNMDFKIMQGNSLLERYEGVDLSKIEITAQKNTRGKKKQTGQQLLVFDEKDALKNIQNAIQEYYRTEKHDKKEQLRNAINDNVREYIRHMNGCTPEIQRKIKKLPIPNDQFFLWHIYFKEVFDEGGFDIVIGNPPYIELQKMKEMSKLYSECGFSTYNKSGDIYCLFTEQGMNLLKDGGTLCYIMMNKWMKADYGKQLRKYLLSRKIHNIVDFGDVQVFKKATTYPCIILLGNSKPDEKFKASRLRKFDLDSIDSLTCEFPTSEFGENIWVVSSRNDQLLFEKLKAGFKTLKEYPATMVKYGIKPGLTEAFLISKEIRDGLVSQSTSAEDVIVPFLSGKDIKPYEQPEPMRYLILFRKGDTLKLMGKDNATEEEAWLFIQKRFPSICEWLQPFEGKARARSDKGDFWWEMRACVYYVQFEKPKIMYQTFQVKPNFIYDTKGCFCNNSMWILPTENKALLGLFNSKIGWWLISNYCTQIQSGYQLIWDYFSRIPIALKPDGDKEISVLVDDILNAKMADKEADTSCLKHKIDCRLYELYGLTNGEVKVIDADAHTFGADLEPYKRKPDFKMTPEEDLDIIYAKLKLRFDKLSRALDNEETEITGNYDLRSTTKPSKEELEDAFFKWNCAILTAFRSSGELSKKDNLERNKKRNEELKAKMCDQGLLFRPVDGYYVENVDGETGTRRVPVNEFSFFVTNTNIDGDMRTDDEKKKNFFKRIYRLAEHYEQDSFLFTFPGANRVAFLVATNNGGRSDFRNDFMFAGPLYLDIEDLDAWTGCSDEGKIAFMLKGMVQKKVPGYKKVRIGEGDIFDIEHYAPECLVVIHDKKHQDLCNKCADYKNDNIELHECIIIEEGISADDVRTAVLNELNKLSNNIQKVGFHSSISVDGSYSNGAKVAYEAVLNWAESRRRLSKIVIVDIFGDYCDIQN